MILRHDAPHGRLRCSRMYMHVLILRTEQSVNISKVQCKTTSKTHLSIRTHSFLCAQSPSLCPPIRAHARTFVSMLSGGARGLCGFTSRMISLIVSKTARRLSKCGGGCAVRSTLCVETELNEVRVLFLGCLVAANNYADQFQTCFPHARRQRATRGQRVRL